MAIEKHILSLGCSLLWTSQIENTCGESDQFYEVVPRVTERLLQAEESVDSFKGEGGNDKRRQGLREHGWPLGSVKKRLLVL